MVINISFTFTCLEAYLLALFIVWALGITIVIGGQYFAWNFGLVAGFGSCCIAFFMIGFMYLSLICSVCEVTSGLPFEGGNSHCIVFLLVFLYFAHIQVLTA